MTMYQKYISEWKKFKTIYGEQTCFFMLVGKFFELYDILDKETQEGQTNVKQAVEILGIALTVKKGDGPKGEDCYFAGIPEVALQKYATILTRENWTVVVATQEKDEKGAVTGRPVSRIFSPGTHIESAGSEPPYLAALWLEEGSLTQRSPPTFAAAVLDLTTGALQSFEGNSRGFPDSWTADELVNFFQIYRPKELLVFWRGDGFTCPTESFLRKTLELPSGPIHRKLANSDELGPLENPTVRAECLKEFFSDHGLLSVREFIGVQDKEKVERCLTSLLTFAKEHIPSAVKNLNSHSQWTPGDGVYLGNHSLVQLNFVSTGPEDSVYTLFQRTITALGKRCMRVRLLHPSSNAKRIEQRLKEVDYFYQIDPELQKHVETNLRLMFDISRLHRNCMIYSCSASDILNLNQSYQCILKLIELLNKSPFSFQPWQTELDEYMALFHTLFDIQKAERSIRDGEVSFLQDTMAPLTKECEDKLAACVNSANETIETLRRWVGLPEEAIRLEGRDQQFLQATMTKTTANLIKKKLATCDNIHGIQVHIRASSRSQLECSKLNELSAHYTWLHANLLKTTEKELPSICKQLATLGESMWSTLEDWTGKVDCNLTLAKVSKQRGYCRPTIVQRQDNSGFQATGLRHPLLESIQTRVEYVKHDVSLGFQDLDNLGWLLYGMNASGKSSLMKSIGIATLLGQAGCYVPAATFKIAPFKSLLTRILNQDNLWAGLSSFAVEMSELRDIFAKADPYSLVLGDELCSGTESVSATSLVAAGIQYLTRVKTRFVFATHLHGLHKLSDFPGLGVWHLQCHYDIVNDRLVYDRTLHKGPGTTLYGIEVARAMHIPIDIVDAALAFRRKLEDEPNYSEVAPSHWNAAIVAKRCEKCDSPKAKELEIHHVQHRATSDAKGHFADGTHQNDLRNLAVLCEKCHDDLHAGLFEIGPVQQTSDGEARSFTTTMSSKVTIKDEKRPVIERYLREHPNIPLKRIIHAIQINENMVVSEAMVRGVRKHLQND